MANGADGQEREPKDIEAERRLAEVARVIPPEMARTSITHPHFNAPLWVRLERWSPADGGWLGLVGEAGRSKSRCAALLARRLILEGVGVLWTTATAFQEAAEALAEKKTAARSRDFLNACKTAPVLCLDDLSKFLWGRDLEARLFALIDYRKTHDLPVIWTSNTSVGEIAAARLVTREFGIPLLARIHEISRIENA